MPSCWMANFRTAGVRLLTDDGLAEFDFDEVAELHLPVAAPWGAWFDQVATIAKSFDSRLIEISTSSGLVATSSQERFMATARGNPARSNHWVHNVQPSWSLDRLSISCGDIWQWRTFAAHQVPLDRWRPTARKYHPIFDIARPPRRNRDIFGKPLADSEGAAGGGFGVHGATTLRFELPPEAEAFRVRVGLAPAVGIGGCVVAKVHPGEAVDQPLYESPIIVGSGESVDSGRIGLPPREGNGELVLTIDPVPKNRPRGADPFDIRDHANWLDPLVVFNREALEAIQASSN